MDATPANLVKIQTTHLNIADVITPNQEGMAAELLHILSLRFLQSLKLIQHTELGQRLPQFASGLFEAGLKFQEAGKC